GRLGAQYGLGMGRATARLEHALELGKDCRLLGREVEEAIAHHAVHRIIGQGQTLGRGTSEGDVAATKLPEIHLGTFEHRTGAVHTNHLPLRPDPLGQEHSIETTAASEFEDGFSRLDLRESNEGSRHASESLTECSGKGSKQGYRVTEITGILAANPELVTGPRRLGDRRVVLGYQPADFRWRQLTDFFPASHMFS